MHIKCKIAIWMIAFLMGLTSCSHHETATLPLATEEELYEDVEKEAQKEIIFVYVCGAVRKEGVYELPFGSRVYEAIEMAGGLLDEASPTQVNQAEVLEDGQQLYIPTKEEVRQQLLQQAEEADGKININTATKEELMTLPGVGEAKAGSIIKYRETNGSFQAIEDIMQISGIKEGLFQKIKEYIKI